VLAVRDAYSKGLAKPFARAASKVAEDHPLRAYVDYWRLKQNGAQNAEKEAFVATYPDSPLAERLRMELAGERGASDDWVGFERWSSQLAKPDNEIRCHTLRARLQRSDPAAVTDAARLYMTGIDLPTSCSRLFALLAERGHLRHEATLARLRLALEARNLRLARELLDMLPDDMRPPGDLLGRAERDAARLLSETQNSPAAVEIALYALTSIARDDPGRAADLWEKQGRPYPVPEQQYGWAQIAVQGAKSLDSRTGDWFAKASGKLSDAQAVWYTRAMLRAGRWPEVSRGIEAMPESMQEEAVWRYWKARSLKAVGATTQANTLFARLSREVHYYGVLATEELPVRIETRAQDYRPSQDELRAVRTLPGVERAIRLRKLGLDVDALTEWQWVIRGMNDPQLLAAAEVARAEGWYDRAINTADLTRDTHNFDLRYLTPYRDLAETYSRRQSLDPAWVFGLMRQESRFIDYARSSAGAIGLMQIMPATAKWIAKQMGDTHAHASVREPETNIRFGTFYLKNIYDRLGSSPVLATAGYNAGPGRAKRWQAATPLEGAIYVESIPITETREYVKKVLTNAMFYSQRLGTPSTSLKDRLGIIPAKQETVPASTSGEDV